MSRQLSRRPQTIAAYERAEGPPDQSAPAPPSSPPRSGEDPSAAPPGAGKAASASPARVGRPPRLDDQDLEFLRELTTQQPQATRNDLLRALDKQRGKLISLLTLHRALQRLGLSKQRAPRAPAKAPEASSESAAGSKAPPRYRPEHRQVPRAPGAYPSDLTDAEWEQVRPLIENGSGRGRPPTQDRRRILDALFYIGRTGCQWRMLPYDYPPWQTVASCFYRWTRRGVLQKVYAELRGAYRQAVGKEEQPSAGIIDSQTVKTTEKGGPRGLMEANGSRGGNVISSLTRSGWSWRCWSCRPMSPIARAGSSCWSQSTRRCPE